MEEDILCRSCMVIINKYEDQNDEKLVEKFCFCTNIVISENDEITKKFCCECALQIESSFNYVKEAHRVDQILKSRLISKSKSSFNKSNENEHIGKDVTEKRIETEKYSLLGLLLSNTNVDISPISCYGNSTFNDYENDKEVDDNEETLDDNNPYFTTGIQTKKCERNDETYTSPEISLCEKEHDVNPKYSKKNFKDSIEGCRKKILSIDSKGSKNIFTKECKPCQKVFKVKHAYTEHMKKHTEQPARCERCNKEFQSVYKLQHHRYLCLKETFQITCKHCGLKFRNQTKLKLHVTSKHSQERPYHCDVCSKQFKFKRILEQHMVIHSNIKPFLCEICGLGLTQANSLKDHRQTHTNETPYKCNLCDFQAKRLSTVTRHKRQHSGERPHQCSYCGRKFYVLFDLKQHIRKHTGEFLYSCPLCTRNFINSTKRKEHMVRAHKMALSDIPRMNKNGDMLLKDQNIPVVPEG